MDQTARTLPEKRDVAKMSESYRGHSFGVVPDFGFGDNYIELCLMFVFQFLILGISPM